MWKKHRNSMHPILQCMPCLRMSMTSTNNNITQMHSLSPFSRPQSSTEMMTSTKVGSRSVKKHTFSFFKASGGDQYVSRPLATHISQNECCHSTRGISGFTVPRNGGRGNVLMNSVSSLHIHTKNTGHMCG